MKSLNGNYVSHHRTVDREYIKKTASELTEKGECCVFELALSQVYELQCELAKLGYLTTYLTPADKIFLDKDLNV